MATDIVLKQIEKEMLRMQENLLLMREQIDDMDVSLKCLRKIGQK